MRPIDADLLEPDAGFDDGEFWAYSKAQVDNAPTITPERKRGRWEIYIISMIDGEGCRCSECGFEGAPYWEFCPNCGADMRGEQDEKISD